MKIPQQYFCKNKHMNFWASVYILTSISSLPGMVKRITASQRCPHPHDKNLGIFCYIFLSFFLSTPAETLSWQCLPLFAAHNVLHASCFSSTANSSLRSCLLPHCLDFRLVMGLLFGAFAKDLPLVPLCFSHCQPHSHAQLYPHASQTLGFLLASKKFIQSYLIHILSASQGHPIHVFPTALFCISFPFARTITSIFQLAPRCL